MLTGKCIILRLQLLGSPHNVSDLLAFVEEFGACMSIYILLFVHILQDLVEATRRNSEGDGDSTSVDRPKGVGFGR